LPVTSKGQVTIPADIRADFEIKTGDQIVFFKKLGGELVCISAGPRLGRVRAFLPPDCQGGGGGNGAGSGGMRYNPGGLDLADDDEEQAA
jgi:AbrB family looped-hinge helix DNA binding protein